VPKIASSKSLVHGRLAAIPLKLADADALLFYTFALLSVGVIQRFLDAYLHGVQGTAFDVAVTHEPRNGSWLVWI
jgi:hypothetical protein